MKRVFIILSVWMLGAFNMAMAVSGNNAIVAVVPYDMAVYDHKITDFFNNQPISSDALLKTAAFFLDAPYLLEPLGEGPDGVYSQEPLYRTDRFDCVTYVDTVLAL